MMTIKSKVHFRSSGRPGAYVGRSVRWGKLSTKAQRLLAFQIKCLVSIRGWGGAFTLLVSCYERKFRLCCIPDVWMIGWPEFSGRKVNCCIFLWILECNSHELLWIISSLYLTNSILDVSCTIKFSFFTRYAPSLPPSPWVKPEWSGT